MKCLCQIFVVVCLLAAIKARGQTQLQETDSSSISKDLAAWIKYEYEDRKMPERFDRYAYIAKKQGWRQIELNLTRELGAYYRETGQPDAAQLWFTRFYQLNAEKGDSLGIALALAHLGNTYMGQGDQLSALEYNQQSLAIRQRHQEQEQPVRLANSYMFVGISYMRLGELEKAEQHFQASYSIRVERADSAGLPLLLSNMGALATLQRRYEQAETYFGQSVELQKKLGGAVTQGGYYLSLGEVYSKQYDYRNALRYLRLAVEEFEATARDRKKADALLLMGWAYQALRQETAAKQAFEEAAAIGTRRTALKLARDAYEGLFINARYSGQYEDAIGYLEQYELFKDSLVAQQNARSLARLKLQQEIALKDNAINTLNLQNAAQSRQRNYLLLGLLILTAVTAVVYFVNRMRKNALVALMDQKKAVEQLLGEKETLLQHLRDTQQQLIQHEKMAALGQLTSGIAHELNNPLNFVINNAAALKQDQAELDELMKHSPADARAIQAVETEIQQLIAGIETGANRMRHIVEELGAFSRAEQGLPERVQWPDIVAESLKLLSQRGAEKWQVEQINTPDLPAISAFSGKLVQMCSNLLSNAFDALELRWGEQTDQGKVAIAARPEGQMLHISISDNGSGISEAVLSRIFDPFYTTKPVGKGTGLGLSIVFAIIKAHKGSIEVQSRVGEGATFHIRLPLA